MVYNSKLSGALLVLAFLACLFVVSSAENIHEQPLSDTALEGGLKNSPNDTLKHGIRLKYLFSKNGPEGRLYSPLCLYKFSDGNGGACNITLTSKNVSCLFEVRIRKWTGLPPAWCPEILNNRIEVLFSETSEGEYQIGMNEVNIKGFPNTFKSIVYRKKRFDMYITYVEDKFNGFSVRVDPMVN
eukprot:Nk52_evm9s237 gene=Nk52_evmTU9s237